MDYKEEFFRIKGLFEHNYPGLQISIAKSKFETHFRNGSFCPDTYTIKIGPMVKKWDLRLLYLVHELGHVVDFWRNHKCDPDSLLANVELAECKAYLYGWAILKRVLPNFKVSKHRWRCHHGPARKTRREQAHTVKMVKKYYPENWESRVRRVFPQIWINIAQAGRRNQK